MPDLNEIWEFFIEKGLMTRDRVPGHGIIGSVERNRIAFVIQVSDRNGYKFSWQTRDHDYEMMDKFEKIEKDIQKLYPGADLRRRAKSRFFIPIDQTNPLVNTLKVITDTKFIVGYTG
jgi:hypothetical protein